jgi:hypothetical protein
MSERERLTAYTQMALLNAITLSLIGIQVIASPAFFLLLWIIPAIFAIQTTLMPLRLTLLSCLIVVGIALLFGLDIGSASVVYVLTGTIAGTLRRWKLPAAVRIPVTTLALTILLAAFVAVLILFLGLAASSTLSQMQPYLHLIGGLTPLILSMLLGLVVVALILAIIIDLLTSGILSRLVLHPDMR